MRETENPRPSQEAREAGRRGLARSIPSFGTSERLTTHLAARAHELARNLVATILRVWLDAPSQLPQHLREVRQRLNGVALPELWEHFLAPFERACQRGEPLDDGVLVRAAQEAGLAHEQLGQLVEQARRAEPEWANAYAEHLAQVRQLQKIQAVAAQIYHAASSEQLGRVQELLDELRENGYAPILNPGLRPVCLAELRNAPPRAEPPSLPLLGTEHGYFFVGQRHLVVGHPKIGKSELLLRSALHWQDQRILWFTEEPPSLFEARLARLHAYPPHVFVCYAAGHPPDELLTIIQTGSWDVIVLDTIRGLLRIADENSNAEVVRALAPFVSGSAQRGYALILVHHAHQAAGSDPIIAPAGGLAFGAIVDVVLYLRRDMSDENRLYLTGRRRLGVIEPLTLTWRAGDLVVVGRTPEVGQAEREQRVLDALHAAADCAAGEGGWVGTRAVLEAGGFPNSQNAPVLRILHQLVQKGLAEGRRGARGGWEWRPAELR